MNTAEHREQALRAVAFDLALAASRIQLQLAVLARKPSVGRDEAPVVKALEESAQGLHSLVRRLADVVEPPAAA